VTQAISVISGKLFRVSTTVVCGRTGRLRRKTERLRRKNQRLRRGRACPMPGTCARPGTLHTDKHTDRHVSLLPFLDTLLKGFISSHVAKVYCFSVRCCHVVAAVGESRAVLERSTCGREHVDSTACWSNCAMNDAGSRSLPRYRAPRICPAVFPLLGESLLISGIWKDPTNTVYWVWMRIKTRIAPAAEY
jgi:hypothetical protein